MLKDRECTNKEVILLHITNCFTQTISRNFFPIYFYVTFDSELASYAKVEHIKETCFARTTAIFF